jgi:uncharacterized Fe-S cluster protein YjdI
VKRYEGEHIEVTYDKARCLHAAEMRARYAGRLRYGERSLDCS